MHLCDAGQQYGDTRDLARDVSRQLDALYPEPCARCAYIRHTCGACNRKMGVSLPTAIALLPRSSPLFPTKWSSALPTGAPLPEMQFAIDVFEVTGHNDSVLGATRVSVNATLPEQQREAKVGSRPVAVPRASNMEGICVLMDELKFTPGHVNSVFDLHDNITGNSVDVLPIKFQKMSMLNSEWHYMRKHQIARFEVDGSINVYGFSSVHVLNHPAWAARLLLLAREISPRSQKEPIACVYEIMKFCGMEVVGTKRHGPPRSDKKKSLEQDAYVFRASCFATNKGRAVCTRQGVHNN